VVKKITIITTIYYGNFNTNYGKSKEVSDLP